MSFLDAIKALKRFFGGQSEQKHERQQPLAPPAPSQTQGKLSTTKTALPTPRPPVQSSKPAAPAASKAQPVGARQPQAKQKMQIVLGLDFGTAFTKAVVREQRACYAVPFNPPGVKHNYLLPGELRIGPDAQCGLGWEDGAVAVKNMKMKLLERQDSSEDHIHVAAFLGLVMRHCRDWLMREHQATYKGFDLDWHMNIGLPTASYHDQKLLEKYRLIALTGWALSLDAGPITLPMASNVFSDIGRRLTLSDQEVFSCKPGMIHPDNLGLFPEFVAQIAGYVRSPLRKADLHILMDVGAGTVDLSIFNIHQDTYREDSFPIYSKGVEHLGTQFLCRHRFEYAKQPMQPLPNSLQDVPQKPQFAYILGVELSRLMEIDKDFSLKIRKLLINQVKYVKEKRYPKSRHWDTGVPLFLCGGGSHVDFYVDSVSEAESVITNSFTSIKIRRTPLPMPDSLKAPGLQPNQYDRLSVAFGLSFNALDIGQIIPSNKICDVDGSPRKPNLEERYVSKEMV